jgi:hypothetical protein
VKLATGTLGVGVAWGISQTAILFYLLVRIGLIPLRSFFLYPELSGLGPHQAAWTVLGISFVFGYVLRDVIAAVMATLLSELVTFLLTPLLSTVLLPSLVAMHPDQQFIFLGLVAPIFLILGMISSLFGSILGAWLQEQSSKDIFNIYQNTLIALSLIVLIAAFL